MTTMPKKWPGVQKVPEISDKGNVTTAYPSTHRLSIDMGQAPPLTERELRMVNFHASEQASQPYEYQLTVHANDTEVSPDTILDFPSLLGRRAMVYMGMPVKDENATQGEDKYTLFNGMIASVSMQEPGVYQMTLRPNLWKLGLCNHYRILKGSIKDVIRQILDEHHIEHSLEGVDGLAERRIQTWMQAGETDLAFISKLMEKVGVYYYFQHTNEGEKVILSTQTTYPSIIENEIIANPLGSQKDPPLFYTSSKRESVIQDNLIRSYSFEMTMEPESVRTYIAEPMAAWEKRSDSALPATHKSFDSSQADDELKGMEQFNIYQYGSDNAEAEALKELETSRMRGSALKFSGSSMSPLMRPGYKFTIAQAGFPQIDKRYRPDLDGLQFVVKSVQHTADIAGTYSNQFEAIPIGFNLSDFSIQQTQMGKMIGTVSPPPVPTSQYLSPKEFYFADQSFRIADQQDPYPRKGVYVLFEGNPEPQWIQLSESMTTVPEVGVSVWVTKSQDDSEIPVIQNAVQSYGNKTVSPVISPLSHAAVNNSVGDNYSISYGDSIGISFDKNGTAPDLKPAINIVQPAYETGDFKDSSYAKSRGSFNHSISGKNVSYSEVETSESTSKIGSQTDNTTIDKQDSTSKIGKSTSNSTIDTSKSTSKIGSQTDNTTIDKQDSTSKIGSTTSNSEIGSSNSKSKIGSQTDDTDIGSQNSTSNIGSQNSTSTIGSSTSNSQTGSSTSANQVGTQNDTSTIGMQSSNSTTGLSNSTSLVGLSNSSSVTGVSTATNLTGVSTASTITGVNDSDNMTLSNDSMSLTADSTGMNITGSENSLSLTGSNTSLSLTGDSLSIQLVGSGLTIQSDSEQITLKSSGLQAQILELLELKM